MSSDRKEREKLMTYIRFVLHLEMLKDEFCKDPQNSKLISDPLTTSPGSSFHDDCSGEQWSPAKVLDINDNIFPSVPEEKCGGGNSSGKKIDDPKENSLRNLDLFDTKRKSSHSINRIGWTPIEPGVFISKTLLMNVVTIVDRNGLRVLKPREKKMFSQLSRNGPKPLGREETSSCSMEIITRTKDIVKCSPTLQDLTNPRNKSNPERNYSQTMALRFNEIQIPTSRRLGNTMGIRFNGASRSATESPCLYVEIVRLSEEEYEIEKAGVKVGVTK